MSGDDDLALGLFLAIMGAVPAILFGGIILGEVDARFRPVAGGVGLVLVVTGVLLARDRLDGLLDGRSDPGFDSRREAVLTLGGVLLANLLVHGAVWFAPDAVIDPVLDALASAFVGGGAGATVAGLLLVVRWLGSDTPEREASTE